MLFFFPDIHTAKFKLSKSKTDANYYAHTSTAMIDAALHDKIDTLTDLEIAVLIPLIVLKHCIIETTASGVDDLERELRLVSGKNWLALWIYQTSL